MDSVANVHTLLPLNGDDWLFKGFTGAEWMLQRAEQAESTNWRAWQSATVPGSVHHDLWCGDQIADPYRERNSLLAEWVPQRTWVYRKTFRVDAEHRGKRAELHFKGVDYDAQFFLNGERLGEQRSIDLEWQNGARSSREISLARWNTGPIESSVNSEAR